MIRLGAPRACVRVWGGVYVCLQRRQQQYSSSGVRNMHPVGPAGTCWYIQNDATNDDRPSSPIHTARTNETRPKKRSRLEICVLCTSVYSQYMISYIYDTSTAVRTNQTTTATQRAESLVMFSLHHHENKKILPSITRHALPWR